MHQWRGWGKRTMAAIFGECVRSSVQGMKRERSGRGEMGRTDFAPRSCVLFCLPTWQLTGVGGCRRACRHQV